LRVQDYRDVLIAPRFVALGMRYGDAERIVTVMLYNLALDRSPPARGPPFAGRVCGSSSPALRAPAEDITAVPPV
jgi:hypothetical protein